LDTMDTIEHVYGPHSYEYEAELSVIDYLLNKELIEKVSPRVAKETLILVTADHGSVDVDPKETIYLNHIPKLMENLQCGGNGERILPTGSPRDIFLHVREEKLTETREVLSRKLAEKAQVIETKEAIKHGLFGIGDASEKFLERAGNLLLLPYGNETIWIECSEGRRANFLGYHGGLSEEEMLVPFGIAKLGSLK
ncbi:MAG: alkaline phosphatase family protein, partial [Candidatus Bathyarchaeia archaeon]